MNRKVFLGALIMLLLVCSPAEVIEKEFTVKPGSKLNVDIETGGDLDVTGWDRDIVQVSITYHGSDCEDLSLLIEERAGDVYVKAECKFNDWDTDCNIDFEVMVPTIFNLDLESKGGDFSVSNVNGHMEGRTMGGDLDLVRLIGNLHFVTMGGEVELRNSEVDGLVKTMGGNVTIRDVVGDVKGKTMGGNVYYKNVTSKDGGILETSTMGGNVNIHSQNQNVKASTMGGNINASGKEVDVSTMGGDIDVSDAPNGADVHTMGGDIYIKYAGQYVKAKTMGGDIDIDAVDGKVKATTMGGDIEVTMIGDPKIGDRTIDLNSYGGDIIITVPDGLDMDLDIELSYTRNSRRNYKIDSDFTIDVEESDEWERSFLFGEPKKTIYASGIVGSGANHVKIKTTNGNISIKKN